MTNNQVIDLPNRTRNPIGASEEEELRATFGFRVSQMRLGSGRIGSVLSCLLGGTTLSLLTAIGLKLHLDLFTISLFYLLTIVLFAVHTGFWVASLISIASAGCQIYFFAPPAYSFYIADPRNAASIVIFEVITLVVSRVSAREKALAIASEAKRLQLKRLYRLSQFALFLKPEDQAEAQLADLIKEEFHLEAVALVNRRMNRVSAAGHWKMLEHKLTSQFAFGLKAVQHQLCDATQVTPLGVDGTVGTLFLMGPILPQDLEALGSLLALSLERQFATVEANLATVARETEQLRTAVLDGLAHAFKTPLTIIRAASTGLVAHSGLNDSQQHLAEMIDGQSTRLSHLTDRLLATARVSPTNLCLEVEYVDMNLMVHDVVQRFHEDRQQNPHGVPWTRSIEVRAQDGLEPIAADHDMMASTLRELLDNAAKYSNSDSTISVSLEQTSEELILSVQSFGALISLEDRERIFDMFYRGQREGDAPGYGIGLSVARRVTAAHQGSIWVTSDAGTGTTFHLSLPRRDSDKWHGKDLHGD